jgi:4-(gamma-glutamylamino)butanal dehydrogenase
MDVALLKSAQPHSSQVTFRTRAFIDGKFVNARSGATFATHNPATGGFLANIAACDSADVDLAVAAARRAFEAGVWSGMAPRDRSKILLKFADLLEANTEELALLETLDTGKPITDSRTADIPTAVETVRWHAEISDKVYDQVAPTAPNIVAMVVREAIGVVGAVLPWNFPLFVAAWKFAPALAAGNSIVLKPAEQTSLSLLRTAELAAEAGIPDGVFNVVPGMGETAGRAIGLHRDIDCVSFTGSTEVGRYFLKYAADSNLKRIVLELGGKSPQIVMADAPDLAGIVHHISSAVLFCMGENCSAGSRLLVHQSRHAEMIELLKAEFSQWTVGDPMDPSTRIGSLIDENHFNKVKSYLDLGVAEGAKLVHGGQQTMHNSGGFFLEPTVFDGVDNAMRIAQEEIFGPVVAAITFKDEEEALRLANATTYGLASSVYTRDLSTAHRMAKKIKAGTVSVNCYSEGDLGTPFGGYKESGFGGRDKGFHAHEQYLQTKTIWIQL